MIPLSLERVSSRGTDVESRQLAFVWRQPANVASSYHAERGALIRWLAVLLTLAIGVAFGHVWLRLQVKALGYHLSAARQVIEKLDREGHDLTLDAARLDAPVRLEELARVRLGMSRPEKGQEVILP